MTPEEEDIARDVMLDIAIYGIAIKKVLPDLSVERVPPEVYLFQPFKLCWACDLPVDTLGRLCQRCEDKRNKKEK